MKADFIGLYAALGCEHGFLEVGTAEWTSTFFTFDICDKEHGEESKMLRSSDNKTKNKFFLRGTKEQVDKNCIVTQLNPILKVYKNIFKYCSAPRELRH